MVTRVLTNADGTFIDENDSIGANFEAQSKTTSEKYGQGGQINYNAGKTYRVGGLGASDNVDAEKLLTSKGSEFDELNNHIQWMEAMGKSVPQHMISRRAGLMLDVEMAFARTGGKVDGGNNG